MVYHVRKSVEGNGWLVQVTHTLHGQLSKPSTLNKLPTRKAALVVARMLAGRRYPVELHDVR